MPISDILKSVESELEQERQSAQVLSSATEALAGAQPKQQAPQQQEQPAAFADILSSVDQEIKSNPQEQSPDLNKSFAADAVTALNIGTTVDIPKTILGLGQMATNSLLFGGAEGNAATRLAGKGFDVLRRPLDRREEKLASEYSPEQKAANKKEYLGKSLSWDEVSKEGIASAPARIVDSLISGDGIGEGLSDWETFGRKALVGVGQSLPGSVVTMGPVGKLSSLAAKEAVEMAAKTITDKAILQKVGEEAAKKAAMISGGLLEGAQGGGLQYESTLKEVRGTKIDDELRANKNFISALSIVDRSLPQAEREKEALDILAHKAATIASGGALAFDAVLGGVGDRFIGEAVAGKGTRSGSVIRGTGQEAITEGPQSAGERLSQNIGVQATVNPNQSLTEGMGEEAISGTISGGIMGGGMGGAFHSSRGGEEKADEGALARNLVVAQLERENLPTRDLIAIRNGEFDKVPHALDLVKNLGITPEHIDGVLQNRYQSMTEAQIALANDANQGPIVRAASLAAEQAAFTISKDKERRAAQAADDAAAIDNLMATYNPGAPAPTDKSNRAAWVGTDKTPATVANAADRLMEGEWDQQEKEALKNNETKNSLIAKPGNAKTRDKRINPPPTFTVDQGAKRRAEDEAAFNRAFDNADDTPENRRAWAGSEPATVADAADRKMQAEWNQQEKDAAENLSGRFPKNVQAKAPVKEKVDPLAKDKASFNESYDAAGTVPASEGNISKEEADKFEAKATQERKAKQHRVWLAGHNKKMAEAEAALKDETVPPEIVKAARDEADKIASSDPVYSHMSEAKKRGKINIEQMRQAYDTNTTRQITRRFPGIFSLVGTVNPDEFASEMGYGSADEMINRFSEARTKKELAAQFLQEKKDEWSNAEQAQKDADQAPVEPQKGDDFFTKAAERQQGERQQSPEWAGATTMKEGVSKGIPARTVYPAPAEAVDEVEGMIKRRPEMFTPEDFDHWTYTAEQQSRLKSALKEATSEKDKGNAKGSVPGETGARDETVQPGSGGVTAQDTASSGDSQNQPAVDAGRVSPEQQAVEDGKRQQETVPVGAAENNAEIPGKGNEGDRGTDGAQNTNAPGDSGQQGSAQPGRPAVDSASGSDKNEPQTDLPVTGETQTTDKPGGEGGEKGGEGGENYTNDQLKSLLADLKAKRDSQGTVTDARLEKHIADVEKLITDGESNATELENTPQPEQSIPASEGKTTEEGGKKAPLLTVEEELAATSDDDLAAMMDDVFGDPAPVPAPATAKAPMAPRAPRQPSIKTTPSAPKEKSPGKIVKEGGIAAVEGVKSAMNGLHALFGGKNRLGSGLAFDEETYAAAKPEFIKAWDHAKKAGFSLKELIQYIGKEFGNAIRPYLERFLSDVKSGDLTTEDKGNTVNQGDSTQESTNTGGQNDNDTRGSVPTDGESTRDVDQTDSATDAAAPEGVAPEGVRGTKKNGPSSSNNSKGGKKGRKGDKGTKGLWDTVPRGPGDNAETLHPQGPGTGSDSGDGKGVVPAVNFRITDDLNLGEGSESVKYNDNVAAIRLLKQLVRDDRRATGQEQRVLARYVGWGGLANVFQNAITKEVKPEWVERNAEITDLLTPEELATAASSTRNAHYTSKDVIDSMWKAVQRLGFKGGNTLEPSSGILNFLGLIPEEIRGGTNTMAVEFDGITAGIAKKLYPQAAVFHSGFEKLPIPSGTIDLVIGNPPFGGKGQNLHFQYSPHLNGLSIHNQFFLAGIDALKPGGIQAMVVSRYMLDAVDSTTREMIGDKAKFLGAVRLPQSAFKKNALTTVVTDIVFLQKRTTEEQAEYDQLREVNKEVPQSAKEWLETGTVPDPLGGEPITVNKYFVNHPEAIVGTMDRSGIQNQGNDVTVKIPNDANIGDLIDRAVSKILPQDIANAPTMAEKSQRQFDALTTGMEVALAGHQSGQVSRSKDGALIHTFDMETESGDIMMQTRTLSAESPWHSDLEMDSDWNWFRVIDVINPETGKPEKALDAKGKVTTRNVKTREVFKGDSSVPQKMRLGENKFKQMGAIVDLRDKLNKQIILESTSTSTEKEVEKNRNVLRQAYEDYIAKYGPTNGPSTANTIKDMPDQALVYSLEKSYTKSISKDKAKKTGVEPRKDSAEMSTILTRRAIPLYEVPESFSDPGDALAYVMSELGTVDMDEVSRLYGKSVEETVKELQSMAEPLVFKNPETGGYESVDEYLSGNVGRKVAAAREAMANEDNTDDYSINISALEKVLPEPWTSDKVTVVLGASWFDPSVYAEFLTSLTGDNATVKFNKNSNSFFVTGVASSAKAAQWGTQRMDASKILDNLLNRKAFRIYDKDSDGASHLNEDESLLAKTMGDNIRAEFESWVMKDSARREMLTNLYNQIYNIRSNRQRSGQHLQMPGKVPDAVISMRRHQKNGIWRGIIDRYVLYDHAVGAGKTFTGIARAMERKRMGISRKPMIVVPNHLVEQFAADVYRLYPGANLLAMGKKDLEGKKRRRAFAKMATGDYDIIIMPHSSFEFIGIDNATETRYLRAEIEIALEMLAQAEEEARDEGWEGGGFNKPLTVKKAEAMVTHLEKRMEKLRVQGRSRDRLLTFEQIGVDDLTIDEAHEFKNLFYSSNLNVKGMNDRQGSARAYNLWAKIRTLREQPRGSVAFMTGTPISNSAVEMYILMKYLGADMLSEGNIEHFDSWFPQFTTTSTEFEFDPTGGSLKETTRLGREWSNMRNLMGMYYTFADCVTNEDIQAQFSEDNPGKDFPIPKVKGGGRQAIEVKATPAQMQAIEGIISRYNSLDGIKDLKERSSERLRLMDLAKKASLDARAVDPRIQSDENGGKLDVISDHVTKIYNEWNDDKGTQLIFLDRGIPKSKGDDKEIQKYDKLVSELNQAVEAGDDDVAQSINQRLEKFDRNEIEEMRLAQTTNWSAYQQLKDNLIAKGIPEKEIRFIQEANTDLQKEALFEDVNAGIVRVLIGSTKKMGAGTNVQQRLVAVHHGDVTYKPSDIEQREGRIIRQGNLFNTIPTEFEPNPLYRPDFEVTINAYVTERTVDATLWDLNSQKMKMINGIRKYKGEFNMEFDDEESVSMKQIAALASGDPLQLERAKLISDVQKLSRLNSAHQRAAWGAEDSLSRAKKRIEELPGEIEFTKAARATLGKAKDEIQSDVESRKVTVNDREFSWTTKDGAVGVIDAAKKLRDETKERFSVTIDGVEFKSVDKATEAIHEALGDDKEFLAVLDGKKYIRRINLYRAITALANDKIGPHILKHPGSEPSMPEMKLGSFSYRGVNFDISVEVETEKEARGFNKEKNGQTRTSAIFTLVGKVEGKRFNSYYHQDITQTPAERAIPGNVPQARVTLSGMFKDPDVMIDGIAFWGPSPDNLEQQLKDHEESLAGLEEKAVEPFAKKEEYESKQERLREVERELSAPHRGAQPAPDGTTDQEPAGPEEDDNGAMLSKAAPVPEGERANLEDEIKSALGGVRSRRLLNSGSVVILDSQKEALALLGGKRNDSIKYSDDGAIQGLYLNGTTYLVRDGIAKGQAFPVLLHELGEHASKLGMKTDEQYQAILDSLESRKDSAGATGEAIRAAMERVPEDTKPEHYWSEVAAYLIENEANKNLSLYDRIANFFKKWLIRAGITSPDSLNNKDLVLFARAAVKAAATGPAGGGPGGGAKLSRKVAQAISSAATSLNQVPALFKKGFLAPGTVNVDIGGGKFDLGTEHLKSLGVENLVLDPFNRSEEHNRNIEKRLASQRMDTATVNNVLNVIQEPEVRAEVIAQAAKAIKVDGTAYFQIHEGDKDGNSRVTKMVDDVPASWQNHQKTEWYMEEVGKSFASVTRKGNVIIASQPKSSQEGNTSTAAFKKWFGASKITKNGQPVMLFHGTRDPHFLKSREYPWIFDKTREHRGDSSELSGLGIFLGGQDIASVHAGGLDGTVHPFFVKIENPYVTTSAELEKKVEAAGAAMVKKRLQELSGHDGIIITDRGHVVVFDSSQVKSATENTGTFSGENQDVRYSKGSVRNTLGEKRAAVLEAMDKGGFSAAIEQDYFKAMASEGEDTVDVADASIPTKAWDWFKSLPKATAKKTLGALTLRQLRDVFAKNMPQMEQFYQATRSMDSDAKKIMTRADEIYNRWVALPKAVAKDMAELMIKATTSEVNPDVAEFEPRANVKALRQKIVDQGARLQEISDEMKGTGDIAKLEAEKARIEDSILKKTDQIEHELKRFRDYQDLSQKYRMLDQKGKDVYQEVKNQYTENLDALYKAIEERISRQISDPALRAKTMDAIRLKYDKYLENGPYFPLSRFGDYISIAEKGDRREVRTFDSLAERTRYTRERRAEGWKVQSKTNKEYSRESSGASSSFVEGIFDILDNSEGMAPAQIENLKDQVNQHFIKSMPDLSHRKHFVHRKKVEGYSRDQMRAFADNQQHAAHHIARIRHADKMDSAVASILEDSKQLGQDENGDDYTNLYNELNARLKIYNNPDISPVTQAITAGGFVMNIGPSIASAVVNLTQTPLVAFPIMATRFKKTGAISAMKALSKASADYFTSKPKLDSGPSLIDNMKLPQHERDMIATLIDDGTIDVTGAHSLAQAAGNDFLNLAKSEHGSKALKVMRLVSYPFHVAELANRKVTALAAYRLALENGMTRDEAINEAREIVLEGHFDYSQANRARWMEGNVRRVLFLFKQYSQQMTWLLGRSFYLAAKGESKEVKSAARKRLAMILGGHFLVSGMQGMPVLGAVSAVAQFLLSAFGDDDEPEDLDVTLRNMLADTIGKKRGDALVNGPWRLIPGLGDLDISSRVSLGDLWFRAPEKEAEGKDKFNQYLNLLLGPTATNASNMFMGLSTMADGNVWRGVETMMPKAIKDAMKAVRYTREGVKNYREDTLIDDIGVMEIFGQALGFSPTKISEMYDGANAIKNHESKVNDRRQMLLNRWVQATRKGDAEKADSVMNDIIAFNEKQPAFSVTGNSLKKSYENRLKVQQNTIDGVYLPATKEDVRKMGRFVNVR